MHTDRPPIEEFLYTMNLWELTEDGNFVIESFDHRGSLDQYIYVEDDFNRLHPQLAAAVHALSEWGWQSRGHKSVYGSDIRNSLDYLVEKVVRFTDCVRQPRTVVCITNIATTTHLPGHLMLIEGDDLDVQKTTVNGQSVAFVVSREGGRKMQVEKHELENQYPGWEGRYNTAISLGLSPNELVAHVFEEEHAPLALPSIATVTFD